MTSPDLIERVRRRLATSNDSLAVVVRDEAIGGGSGVAGGGVFGIADDAVLGQLERRVSAELLGAGPLEPLLAMPGVTDVLVNSAHEVWIDRADGLQRTSVSFADDDGVRRLAQRLAAGAGRRLDDASPFVDAVLADGTRLHAVLPPLVAHPTMSLRVLARRHMGLNDLVASGSMPPAAGELLRAIVAARLAFVISGGTGTGKTTLLGALLSCCDPGQRIVVIEDAAELVTEHPHVVRLMCRNANIEGAGAIGLADLVRQALRMRPDRVVVGEFRGAELVELLGALNTGHEGGAATLHANAVADVPARFAALGALAGLDWPAVRAQVASAFDVVIQLRRDRLGHRALDAIAAVTWAAGELVVLPAWTREGVVAAGRDELARRFTDRGFALPEVLG
jgi:pilus assembly protein CpaF